MADAPNPHDALFRLLLEDPQRAHILLREQLPPAIAARLSEAPPKLLDGHFVDERLRNTQSDRLYELRLRDGGAALLYVLLEHKSAPDPRTPLQLLGYMVRIWERHAGTDGRKLRRLPPIFPLVVYHGAAPWRVPTSVLDCLAADAGLKAELQGFGYRVRDLGHIPYEQLSADPAVRGLLGVLRYAFARGLDAATLARLLRDIPDDGVLLRPVLLYIVRQFEIDERVFWAALADSRPARQEELKMTLAQEWIRQGKAQGREEGRAAGRQEGLQQGEATVLLRLLSLKFGPLSAADRARVEQADAETLLLWSERVLVAERLAQVWEE